MNTDKLIYAVKGGIPDVAQSTNPEFYALCYDFTSNIGYIEKRSEGSWRLYTRKRSIGKSNNNFKEDDKFYYNGNTFEDCTNKLKEMSGAVIKMTLRKEVEEAKAGKISKSQ